MKDILKTSSAEEENILGNVALRMKDILKTSSAEEENILGNVALSPPAEEEDILATAMPLIETLYVVETLYAIGYWPM